jgi:hypothetical protein
VDRPADHAADRTKAYFESAVSGAVRAHYSATHSSRLAGSKLAEDP